jgi:hypothetical protein
MLLTATDVKVGDWVIYDCKMMQVMRIFPQGGLDLSDGMFRTSGPREVYLATAKSKRIAEICDRYHSELYEKYGRIIQNWPGLKDKAWELCTAALEVQDDDDALGEALEKAEDFYTRVKDKAEEVRAIRIDGHKIFERR